MENRIYYATDKKMAEISLGAVDIEEVLDRLTLHAQNLITGAVCVGLDECVLRGGDGPGDLASATLLKFLDPQDTTVRWSEGREPPTTSSLLDYLRKVLDRDFLDLVRSKRYKTTVYADTHEEKDGEEDGDGKSSISLDQLAVDFETPEGKALRQGHVGLILKQFETAPELKEIIKLQLDPEGYNAFTNQELAQLLETSVDDIENRKKRIKLRLKKLAKLGERGPEEADHV